MYELGDRVVWLWPGMPAWDVPPTIYGVGYVTKVYKGGSFIVTIDGAKEWHKPPRFTRHGAGWGGASGEVHRYTEGRALRLSDDNEYIMSKGCVSRAHAL